MTCDQAHRQIYTISATPSELIPIKTKYRSYVRIRRWALMTVGMLILIVLSALLTRFLFRQAEAIKVKDVCYSAQCLRTANNLKMSMDTSIDPCENFGEFVCGKWNTAFPTTKLSSHTWFHMTSERRRIQMRDIFHNQDDDTNFPPTKSARRLYQSCIENERNYYFEKSEGANDIRVLRSLLKSLRLPYDEDSFVENRTRTDFLKSLASVRRKLDTGVYFSSLVVPYPLNNKYNVFLMYILNNDFRFKNFEEEIEEIQQVDDILLKRKSQREPVQKSKNVQAKEEDPEEEERKRKQWIKLIKDVFLEVVSDGTYLSGKYEFPYEESLDTLLNQTFNLLKNWNEEINCRILDDFFEGTNRVALMDVTRFLASVQKYRKYWFKHTGRNISQANDLGSWSEYFHVLLEDILPESFDKTVLQSIPIVTFKMEKLLAMITLFDEVDSRVLEMFLWSRVVRTASRFTSGKIRRLFDESQDAPTEKTMPDITISCSNKVQDFMPFATFRMFMEHEERSERINIREFYNRFMHINDSYSKMIGNAKWLDDTSRNAVLKKLESMKWMIGYPDWIKEDDELLEYYSDVTIDNDDYLWNWVELESFSMYGTLESLLYQNDEDELMWPPLSPLVVNAFYMPTRNQITIPYGIITYPFYDLGIEAMNFGALGLIIGHEISHGFDPFGKNYDHNGNYKNTWTTEANSHYQNRATCYVKHYNDYHIPSADQYVNGTTTLGENVADNCGIKASFFAFKQWTTNHGDEAPFLPGFAEYTHEQLFYISFANIWCGRLTDTYLKSLIKYDVHAPASVRILATLRNSPEFGHVWNCPEKSYMNPQQKCSVW